jgi:multimeric flavodoxin WrbA
MIKIAIVFHSGYGHTEALAKAVARGAERIPGVAARLISTESVEGSWEELKDSDAILFGSPTYMGNVSAPFKAFMDASSKAWLEQSWKDKIAAGFTISGSPSGDKLNTLQSLMIFAMQHGMIWVGNAVLPYNEEGLNRLGSFSGVMAQAGQVAPDVEPGPQDLATAEAFGLRVAGAAQRWKKGA